ncbi:hypothetical protein LSH36_443g04069 [Paralvinella palmiformis]|uniref:Uncharacterized protein n=1 Tax=Paralvinella palmiformis TaxID=53620 RepID=A0AAD9JAQ8_9ANNE|nr:hypothetical protein LSH36_443g04069 [Paralvinella palmiformis]
MQNEWSDKSGGLQLSIQHLKSCVREYLAAWIHENGGWDNGTPADRWTNDQTFRLFSWASSNFGYPVAHEVKFNLSFTVVMDTAT